MSMNCLKQLLTIENSRDTIEQTGTEYAVYENIPLSNLLYSIINILNNVLVSTVMKEAKVFCCLYDLWFILIVNSVVFIKSCT